ncbi:glycosyltransferase family 87 protein [Nocardioides ochotonae]|uniref:glycosyltransferase family 87 protein n=1 Tax=Nocardioides ochotonae TaxID=2685869 RepID=UPI00140DE216|nr:glycosyltransferase 87 family protein [Nocardioides ochotonae]
MTGAPGGSGPYVDPTRDDPAVGALSAGVGGPVGRRAGRHPWWTPVRVLLALVALTMALGMVQKAPCVDDEWSSQDVRATYMCYSDLPYLYTGRGFVEAAWPFDDDAEVRERYEVMEYPVGIAYFAYATAKVTHALTGADAGERADRPTEEFWGDDRVQREITVFLALSALAFALAAMLAVWFLAGVNRRRPWDAALFAVSPALLVTGLVNWDLLAVVLVAGALWAWAKDRPVLTGVLIGLGVATKLYPLFLLGAILVICLCDRRMLDFVRATAAAALAWVLANLPAYLSGPEEWRVFWSFNSERGPDLGSAWLVAAQWLDRTIEPETINLWSWLLFGAWCVGVFVIGVLAPETPRFAQLGFLIVAGFLLVNKVYSPQYVLWLLPLAVLARPRLRDQAVWQLSELFYFAAVWWYLAGWLAPGGGDDPGFYWLAIVLRIAGELYLVALVVRDVLRPQHDPVRAAREAPAAAPPTPVPLS